MKRGSRIILVLLALGLNACPASIDVRPQNAAAFDDGVNAFVNGDYITAAYRLQAFLDGNPNSAKAPEAHYWLGLSHMMTGKPRDAVAHLSQAKKVAPEPWLYNMGVATMRCGDLNGGRDYLRQLVRDYPKGEEAKKARDKLALTERGYMVQMGYFGKRDNAEKEAEKRKKAGIACVVRESATAPGAGYYILAGPYPTWEETIRQADRIKQMGIPSIPLP